MIMNNLSNIILAKEKIFEYIVNRHGLNAWSKYWTSYKNFISGNIMKHEFEIIILELFELSNGK